MRSSLPRRIQICFVFCVCAKNLVRWVKNMNKFFADSSSSSMSLKNGNVHGSLQFPFFLVYLNCIAMIVFVKDNGE